MDCIWVNLKNVGPPFFKFTGMSVYTFIKMSFTELENHSQLLCGHDFAKERLLVCQYKRQFSQTGKNKNITSFQNGQKVAHLGSKDIQERGCPAWAGKWATIPDPSWSSSCTQNCNQRTTNLQYMKEIKLEFLI